MFPYLIAFHNNQRGFTVIELLSASLLTLFFFGWLTYAYLTVTRAAIHWQEDWSVASVTNQALGRIIRDVESTVTLDDLTSSGLTITLVDGQRISYVQRQDGVYRNAQKLGPIDISLTSLRITRLHVLKDSTANHLNLSSPPETSEAENSISPDWLRVEITGRSEDQTYTAYTTVRLYSLRPPLLRED